MMRSFKLLFTLLAVLLLNGCGTSGSASGSVHVSAVYGGYGYPYYNYGYRGCCYGSPGRPDRPNRPVKPDRPAKLPSTRPRPSGGMGRPARMPSGRRR
ncbi:MAG: hypothetical protein DIZ80_11525 [endosymbiont of Galathealinum brachiosum]|uniref:Lipoprotein n=1 Tax=endosymbiont of Galathealinum brachiosum TaxID=2200906 RepID=A0A370DDD1_9GAMM|nr:MAG: hypothetical protein DIZ80_11525 [endosymbiont of Galathealinum brachiosum]